MGRGSYSHFAQYASSQGQKQFSLCINYKTFLISAGIPDFYAVGSHLAEKRHWLLAVWESNGRNSQTPSNLLSHSPTGRKKSTWENFFKDFPPCSVFCDWAITWTDMHSYCTHKDWPEEWRLFWILAMYMQIFSLAVLLIQAHIVYISLLFIT